MPLPEDYSDAAERHFADACYLLGQARLATADHLFGIAGECALKAVLEKYLGATSHKQYPSRYKVHLPEIWEEFQAFRPANGAPVYNLPLANPFTIWDVADRYAAAGKVKPARVQRHEAGAREAMKILERARLDGLL